MPAVGGHAKVEGKGGRLTVNAEFTHLDPGGADRWGTVILLCGVGDYAGGRRGESGGRLPGGNGKDKLDVTTDLQAFGMIVTGDALFFGDASEQ